MINFRDHHADEVNGTIRELTVSPLVGVDGDMRLQVTINVLLPNARSVGSYSLARYRVRALIHALQQYLEETDEGHG